MSEPWKDWIPGVLSKRQVRELCGEYILNVENPDKAVDYSSIDLTLSDEAWSMQKGSIKPADIEYRQTVLDNSAYAIRVNSSDGIFDLQRGQTYVFRIQERLHGLRGTPIHGQATAKSSVGRVDVLARLIVDEMRHYEYFTPQNLPSGEVEMFLEISPITFNVRVKAGESLSQMRLFFCAPGCSCMRGEELFRSILHRDDGEVTKEPFLSVDLENTIEKGEEVCAFCAKLGTPPVDLWKHSNADDRPDPGEFWEFLKADDKKRLAIQRDRFYIIRSKERLCVPKGIAVYCRAVDEAIGEMRVHYAGFVHPFFGKRKDKTGTPLMFEVREHSFPVSLRDGERLARLEFYRMSEDWDDPQQEAGAVSATEKDVYNMQELKLSKFFRSW